MKQKSFSLIEILLYISMVSIIILAVSTLLAMILNARIKTETMLEVESQGQFLVETITKSINEAQSVNLPAATTGDSLSLATNDVNTTPTVYALSSGALTIAEGALPNEKLTNSKITVSNLNFTNTQNAGSTSGAIQVNFTISFNNTSNRNEYDYQKTFQTTASIEK